MKTILLLIYTFFSITMSAQSFSIYLSDAGNFNLPPWQILKYDSNGQNPTVFINTNLNWPQDILFLEDSNQVLISNLGTGAITKHDATSGAFLGNFASGISGPTRTKIGPDGLLYVLQWNGSGKVKRYNLNGAFVDDFTSVGVPQSIGLDWDSSNNLYVSSYNGDMVRSFDTTGTLIGTFIDSNLVGPTNIWFDSNGDLLVADYDGGAIKRFDSLGNYFGVFIAGLNNCEGIAYAPNGNLLVGNGGTHSVKMYTANGSYLRDVVSNGSGNLLTPNAVVIRQSNSASVSIYDSLKPNIIYPSQGVEFNISEDYYREIESIKVYDAEGKLVHIQTEIQNPCWVATSNAAGLYTITVKLREGGYHSQVLVVNK